MAWTEGSFSHFERSGPGISRGGNVTLQKEKVALQLDCCTDLGMFGWLQSLLQVNNAFGRGGCLRCARLAVPEQCGHEQIRSACCFDRFNPVIPFNCRHEGYGEALSLHVVASVEHDLNGAGGFRGIRPQL